MGIQEIQVVIAEEAKKISYKAVGLTEPLMQSGLLDSLAMVDLVVALEERFGINIDVTEINPERFENVEMISRFILTKMNN